MKWFKHMSNASEGVSLCRIMDNFGLQGYGAYFIIVEMCASIFTKEHDASYGPVFTINKKRLRDKLRLKSKQTEIILRSFSEYCLFSLEQTEFEYIINFPKLRSVADEHTSRRVKTPESLPTDSALELELELELKEKKKKKKKKKKTPPPPPARLKILKGPIDQFASIPNDLVLDMLNQVSHTVQLNWVDTHKDKGIDWVKEEVVKGINYHFAKGEETGKKIGYATAITNWLQRARNPPSWAKDDFDGDMSYLKNLKLD